MHITRNLHILCNQKFRRHPDIIPKEYRTKNRTFFYTHNLFTTMTKRLAIAVVKNMIYDKQISLK